MTIADYFAICVLLVSILWVMARVLADRDPLAGIAPAAHKVRLSRTSIADEMRKEHCRRTLGE